MAVENFTDIEGATRKPGDKYSEFTEKSLVGVYIVQDGVFKFVNRRFLEILGGDKKDVIGTEYTKFIAPECIDEIRRGVSKMEGDPGEPKHRIFRAMKTDGTKIYVEVFSLQITYEGKSAIQGMALDITEREMMEGELKKSETRYKTLVEEMLEGLWVSDENDETLYWNKSLENMLGYRFSEVIGKPVHHFTDNENSAILKKELAKRRKNKPSVYELEYVSKSGKRIPVIVSGAPTLDADGNFSGSFAIIMDISERKKMEGELLRYTEQLKMSNMLKDLFADIVHHDFISLLGIIKNYTDLMIYDEKDGQKVEKLDVILNTVERIICMIDDSNKLARLETEEEPEFKKMDLGTMLDTTIEALKHGADENNVTIVYTRENKYLADVNPVMEDIFINLISNAIKFSSNGGKIIVDVFDEIDEWKIMVKDNGAGIEDKYKKSIFGRFNRVSKEGVKGTGLGLAIVERVVNLHKGKVWVEDNNPCGSIFYVTVPKKRETLDAPVV